MRISQTGGTETELGEGEIRSFNPYFYSLVFIYMFDDMGGWLKDCILCYSLGGCVFASAIGVSARTIFCIVTGIRA